MKRINLLIVLLLFAIASFSDYHITRGPAIGEIYFIGPTHTGLGLYYSTDFGETAICMDSIIAGDAISIVADKTPGILYYVTSLESFFISYDYGQQGTWDLQNGEVGYGLFSGRDEGEILASFYMQSDDFGENFYYHNCNGFFGGNKGAAIDNMSSVGYAFAYDPDTSGIINVFYTDDDFENMNVVNSFDFMSGEFIFPSRGFNFGELYLFNWNRYELYYTNDFADNFYLNEYYNFENSYHLRIVGGRQENEIYIMYGFVNMMWQNSHTYILHSLDNGVTFNVYHPFAKGNEPVLSNFSTLTKEVFLMDEIEFDNYSIGDIIEYQWDFDNDGTVDSYDEFPVHIYQDTGWYSVKLSVVGPDSTNSFIKEDYIHVIDTITSINKIEKQPDKIRISPNPFSSVLTIQINNKTNSKVEIFNCRGEIVYKTESTGQSIIWDGCNITGKKCRPGIYYIKTNNSVNKVILSN